MDKIRNTNGLMCIFASIKRLITLTTDQEIQALKKEVALLKELVFQITLKVDMVTQENIELRKELAFYKSGRNSSNSSMPPSSDIKPPNRNLSLREKSNKKQGGQ